MRVNGTVKMRNGRTAKRKTCGEKVTGGRSEGVTLLRKAAQVSTGQKRKPQRQEKLREACMAVLNISIRD